jgi:light-harvesting protein B-800-850 beta chain
MTLGGAQSSVAGSTPVQGVHATELPSTTGGSMYEKSDPNKVWPTGLTEGEAQELHRNLIQGTQIFGFISVLAHLFAYLYSPWLK